MADGSAPAPPPRWYYRPWFVVLLLFFVLGPFGLPLLWKSPAFSRSMKIALAVAVMAYTVLFVETVLVAVRAAMEQMEQMGLTRAPITTPAASHRPGRIAPRGDALDAGGIEGLPLIRRTG